MGRKSREKAGRRRSAEFERRAGRPAEFSVFCPGMLEVLSIAKGELKIEIGNSDEDREKARRVIEEMLRKGYTIFVEVEHYGPVKVSRFDPKAMTYIVADMPEPEPPAPRPSRPTADPDPERRPRRRRRETVVPVAGSKATAVGRTAGG